MAAIDRAPGGPKKDPVMNGARKNVAKKSTTKLPVSMKTAMAEDTPILERLASGMNGQSKHVTEKVTEVSHPCSKDLLTGNVKSPSSGKKRPQDSQMSDSECDNPAKVARTQIASLERKQEEMLTTAISNERTPSSHGELLLSIINTSSRESSVEKKAVDNPTLHIPKSSTISDVNPDSQSNIECDSSIDVEPPKINHSERSLFSVAAKMKDSFKSITTIKAAAGSSAVCSPSGQSDSDLDTSSKTDQVSSTTAKPSSSSEGKPAFNSAKSNLFESFSDLSAFQLMAKHLSSKTVEHKSSPKNALKDQSQINGHGSTQESNVEVKKKSDSELNGDSKSSESPELCSKDVSETTSETNETTANDTNDTKCGQTFSDQQNKEHDMEKIIEDHSTPNIPVVDGENSLDSVFSESQHSSKTDHEEQGSSLKTQEDSTLDSVKDHSDIPLESPLLHSDASQSEIDSVAYEKIGNTSDQESPIASLSQEELGDESSKPLPSVSDQNSKEVQSEETLNYRASSDETQKPIDASEGNLNSNEEPSGESLKESLSEETSKLPEIDASLDSHSSKEEDLLKEKEDPTDVEDEGLNAKHSNMDVKADEDGKLACETEKPCDQVCIPETKEGIKPTEDVDSKTKKRSLSGENEVHDTKVNAKKSRLNALIGKLGNHLETTQDKDVLNASQESLITESTMSAEDMGSIADTETSDRVITVKVKDLERMIQLQMEQFLQTSHGSLIASLQKRIDTLTKKNEEWRTIATQMQTRITELTTKQKRQTRSAAKTAKRNMSLQVDDGKETVLPMLGNQRIAHRELNWVIERVGRSLFTVGARGIVLKDISGTYHNQPEFAKYIEMKYPKQTLPIKLSKFRNLLRDRQRRYNAAF